MASNSNSAQSREIKELRERVEWLDEERRKLMRKLTELEQGIALKERDLSGRERRIKELEEQVGNLSSQLSRLPQVDAQLDKFKDEIVQMIEQYDQRRVQSETELDRLRRVEHETTAREIAEIRKELPTIGRLQHEMELRQSEESRLANLIGAQQGKISALDNRVESWEQALSFLEEKEKQDSRNIGQLEADLVQINKRWAPLQDRLDSISNKVTRFESELQTLLAAQEEIRETMKGWMEQIQVGEYERNQRLENWRRLLDEHTETMEKFSKEWITFSDQYKEAKMAVQTLSDWQDQLEQQQREASELLRVESHRMQSRWDNFLLENEKKWKSFELETEQRWATVNRHEKQIQEQVNALEETLAELEQEKDLIRRVQNAQSDAIKQLPRIWLEEVEKAISQNPNRRRQPALVPVREE